VQDGFLAVHDQRVTGVIAALKTHDNVGLAGEKVDDFAFALVAPLGADDCDVCHISILDFGLPILDWNLKSKI
jgi:hypothetical protein